MYEKTHYTLDDNGQRLIAHINGGSPVVLTGELTAAERQLLELMKEQREPQKTNTPNPPTPPAPEGGTPENDGEKTIVIVAIDPADLPEDSDDAAQIVLNTIETEFVEIPEGKETTDCIFRIGTRDFIVASAGAGYDVVEVEQEETGTDPAE